MRPRRPTRGFGIFLLGTCVAVAVATTRGQQPQQQASQAAQAPAAATGFVAGQVLETGSSRPVPGATVQILGRGVAVGQINIAGANVARGQVPVVADSQGRFYFNGLLPGAYAFVASMPGYTSVIGGRMVDVSPGARIVDWKVRIAKYAVLAGTLRDPSGDPIVGTEVLALERVVTGSEVNFYAVGSGRSDDRGVFRIGNLDPGDYVVCACTREPIPFDGQLLTTIAAEPSLLVGLVGRALAVGAEAAQVDNRLRTYAPAFYSSSTTLARATHVKLASGDERAGLYFILEPTPAVRVSGTVVGANSPVTSSSIRLVPAGELDAAVPIVSLSPVLVQPDGRFDFAGVPPGQYVLRVNQIVLNGGAPGPTGSALQFLGERGREMSQYVGPGVLLEAPAQWAAQPITVGEDGISGLQVPLRPAAAVHGRFEFQSAPGPIADAMSRVSLGLRPLSMDPTRPVGLPRASVKRDGTFEMPAVLPGRYVLTVSVPPGSTTMKSVTIGGADVMDLPIDMAASDINDLVVTWSDAPRTVLLGTVAGVTAVDELMAVVFPTDRRYWAEPRAANRRFAVTQVSAAGAFRADLNPGEYFVMVVADLDAAINEPGKLEAWSTRAQRVVIAPGETKTIEVRK